MALSNMKRRSPRRLVASALLLATAFAGSSAASAVAAEPQLYWTSSNDSVGRVEVDGDDLDPDFVTGADDPAGPSVTGSHLYWAERGTDSVARVALDGRSPELTLVTGASDLQATAVDPGHVYWNTDRPFYAVGRAELDGSNATQSYYGGPADVTSLAKLGDAVYFASDGDRIGWFSPSGGSSHLVPGIGAETIAVTDRHLYWTDPSAGTIGRANLDGRGVDEDFVDGLGEPAGVATDGTHLYWGDRDSDTIGRANLDGSAVDTDWIDGVVDPTGLAISTPSLSATTPSLSFGQQAVGTTGTPQSVTFENTSEVALQPTGVAKVARMWLAEDVDDFAIASDGCTGRVLAAGDTCTVEVRFAPTATGNRAAELHLTSNAWPQSPTVVALSGTGVTPEEPTQPEGHVVESHRVAPAAPGGPRVGAPSGSRAAVVPAAVVPVKTAGAPRPRSAAGDVRVRCADVQKRSGGAHGAARTRCEVTLRGVTASGAKPQAKLQARLTSARGKVVARAGGRLRSGGLTLTADRRLGAGRYVLTVTVGGERTTRTITLR